MKIDAINQSSFAQALSKFEKLGGASEENTQATGFREMLGNQIGEVNKLLQGADKASNDVAVGKSENLHEAMVSFEKAETALKFLVQVRNKAIDAYQEIIRMQV
jgi:flagellar hook-basal body complex protein FliE